MQRLAGSRLLRLREQGQIEQRNDLSETLAGFPDPVDGGTAPDTCSQHAGAVSLRKRKARLWPGESKIFGT